jgi:hypothetical protein
VTRVIDWIIKTVCEARGLPRWAYNAALALTPWSTYPAYDCDYRDVSRCAFGACDVLAYTDAHYVVFCAAHTVIAVQEGEAYLAESPGVRVYCPVCDATDLDEPWPNSHQICGQCGTQFGYDDSRTSHAALRAAWIAGGRQAWRAKEAA